MRQLLIVGLLAIGGLAISGCSSHNAKYPAPDGMSAAGTMTHRQVAMLEFHFRPESLDIVVGDTVTWTNHGRVPHTTVSGVNGKPDGRWNSGHLSRGNSFSYVFTEPGTYRYYCAPHHSLGMKGVVVVSR